MVSEHKDIVRSVMALQGMMYMYKPDIEKLLKVRPFFTTKKIIQKNQNPDSLKIKSE